MIRPTRRRFLAISAAAAMPGTRARATALPQTRWQGRALGAAASVLIAGLEQDAGAPVLDAVTAELERLESIFSLYRPDSALVRLNATGRLPAPPPELLEVLSLAGALHHATGGAFDPTVQPLFMAHARAASEGRQALPEEIDAARELVGWTGLDLDPAGLRLPRQGAALTLNGIAQGYVTDRIAALLQSRGLHDVLVDAGETAARGHRPGGTPWIAGIAAPDGTLIRKLHLSDRALATSAPRGTVLDPNRQIGHIFNPSDGGEAKGARIVSVSAPSAILADGLSTALCAVPRHRHTSIVEGFPGARIEAFT